MATNTANVEFIQGNEQHSSSWYKYYVKGLEKWQCKEDFAENRNDNHHSYNGYVANDIPEGTVFTIFQQDGSKRGTDRFYFTICVTDSAVVNEDLSGSSGRLQGNFRRIVAGNGKVKAPRLMNWWTSKPENVDPMDWANHCRDYIDKRGQKELPRLEIQAPTPKDLELAEAQKERERILAEIRKLEGQLQEVNGQIATLQADPNKTVALPI